MTNSEYSEIEDLKQTAFEDGKIAGMLEVQKRAAIVLKNEKMSLEFIMEITGLSAEEIENL